jgi:hypothetical protein
MYICVHWYEDFKWGGGVYSNKAESLLLLADEFGIKHDGLDSINGTNFYVYGKNVYDIIDCLNVKINVKSIDYDFSDWKFMSYNHNGKHFIVPNRRLTQVNKRL